MIDLWLILCQLVPFTQVVLLTAMEYLRADEKEKQKKEKLGKRKRKGEKKLRKKKEKEEKHKKYSHSRQSITSAKNTTGDDLQLDLRMEDGVEDKPLQAWALPQISSTKTSFVTTLMVIGEYLTLASI